MRRARSGNASDVRYSSALRAIEIMIGMIGMEAQHLERLARLDARQIEHAQVRRLPGELEHLQRRDRAAAVAKHLLRAAAARAPDTRRAASAGVTPDRRGAAARAGCSTGERSRGSRVRSARARRSRSRSRTRRRGRPDSSRVRAARRARRARRARSRRRCRRCRRRSTTARVPSGACMRPPARGRYKVWRRNRLTSRSGMRARRRA